MATKEKNFYTICYNCERLIPPEVYEFTGEIEIKRGCGDDTVRVYCVKCWDSILEKLGYKGGKG